MWIPGIHLGHKRVRQNDVPNNCEPPAKRRSVRREITPVTRAKHSLTLSHSMQLAMYWGQYMHRTC
jgi:hypothetical protein